MRDQSIHERGVDQLAEGSGVKSSQRMVVRVVSGRHMIDFLMRSRQWTGQIISNNT